MCTGCMCINSVCRCRYFAHHLSDKPHNIPYHHGYEKRNEKNCLIIVRTKSYLLPTYILKFQKFLEKRKDEFNSSNCNMRAETFRKRKQFAIDLNFSTKYFADRKFKFVEKVIVGW